MLITFSSIEMIGMIWLSRKYANLPMAFASCGDKFLIISEKAGCTDEAFFASSEDAIRLANNSLSSSVSMRYFAASSAGPTMLSDGSIRSSWGMFPTFSDNRFLNCSRLTALLYASFS